MRRKQDNRTKSNRKLEPVTSSLMKLLERYNLAEGCKRYEFVTKWREIVGEEMAKRTKPEFIKNGALVVSVKNAAWAQELSYSKTFLIEKLSQTKLIFGTPDIKDIRFNITG